MVVVGDFNADPFKGRFWNDLGDFMQSMSFSFLDGQLPRDTFTYLCPAKDTTSWLDHIFCSRQVAKCITNIRVNYETSIFDHFPLHFDFEFSISEMSFERKPCSVEHMVNWHRLSEKDKEAIRKKIELLIVQSELLDHDLYYCMSVGCENKSHHKSIDSIYENIRELLLISTNEFSVSYKKLYNIVPGWNEFVKDLYTEARNAFKTWMIKGKPLEGACRDIMRAARANFKQALNYCKENEESIRNRRLADNLKNKNYKDFWSEVHKTKGKNDIVQTMIDNENEDIDIARNFAQKYKSILNKNNTKVSSATDVNVDLSDIRIGHMINLFSVTDIKEAMKCLKPTIGHDNIHTNHLLLAPDILAEVLAKFFTACVIHGYLPPDMIKGIINPIVKDIHGDLSNSDNYRPVMSSSVLLKLLEYCILQKISGHMRFNDRQHGFRSKYSTVTACLALKETVFHYINSDTPVYSCFIDFSKAFDNVNHKILI